MGRTHQRDSRHREVFELLPWYANGTLEDDERTRVEEHLSGCEPCRDGLVRCHALAREVAAAETVSPSPHPAQLRRLMQRVDAVEAGKRRRGRHLSAPARGIGRLAALAGSAVRSPVALRWALAVQLVLILALGALLLVRPPAPEAPATFHTLSDPAAAPPAGHGDIRVVFAEEATAGGIRTLLREVEVEIVGGPSPLGAYTLRLPAGHGASDPVAVVVEHLRASALVRFAEPVGGARDGRSSPGE